MHTSVLRFERPPKDVECLNPKMPNPKMSNALGTSYVNQIDITRALILRREYKYVVQDTEQQTNQQQTKLATVVVGCGS